MGDGIKLASPEAGPSNMEPSSSIAGYFQEHPKVGNGVYEDAAFKRMLGSYVPSSVQEAITPDISSMGDLALSKKVLAWIADAERNVPYLKTWDTFGKRKDELVTSEGWRRLQKTGIEEGIVAIPYENKIGPYSRVHQFLKYHLWSGSCASVTCPSAMTDGAASLLSRHLSTTSLSPSMRQAFQSAFLRLTSRDSSQAWTSGQWMTERKGGSDVSGTETIANAIDGSSLKSTSVDGSPLGPYSISGFKWFSSATDADMAILLARTSTGRLSAFYAPMQRTRPNSPTEIVLNGVTIQRLKSKLGTRSLPTAELVLNDMRGYLIGQEGNGVREISTLLNITRIHNSAIAMGYWGRGLAISRAFARVRTVSSRKLTDVPAHVATMAFQHVEYRGWMHLTFFTVLLLGVSEQLPSWNTLTQDSTPSIKSISTLLSSHTEAPILLLRLLTPILKALTAKFAIAALAECMESLGGVGYLDSNDDVELNVARLFRDANVLSIWEGTTDVLAADMIRVLKGRQGKEVLVVLERWLEVVGGVVGKSRMELEPELKGLRHRWQVLRTQIENAEMEELLLAGREVMLELGRLVAGALLIVDAGRDGDPVASEIARRWMRLGRGNTPEGTSAFWKEKIKWNKEIVFGSHDSGGECGIRGRDATASSKL